jgi:hypothetical protein
MSWLERTPTTLIEEETPPSTLERWTGLGDIVVYTMAYEPVYTDDGCIVVIQAGYDHLSGMIPEDRPKIGLDEVPTEGATWQLQ